MQISEVSVKVCFVSSPRQPVHAGGGVAFEREERQPERCDIDVVEERGKPLLLSLPCGLPYAFQRLCHAFPVLCPVRALLARVPLGPHPWLRCRLPGFVRRLPSYYGGGRLLIILHHRVRLPPLPLPAPGRRPTRPFAHPVIS